MSGKAPKTKKFTSKSGKEYTFQQVLPSVWLDTMDNVEDASGKKSRGRLYEGVLETVVVQPPGLKPNDFEDFAELDEVVTAATRFQQGK